MAAGLRGALALLVAAPLLAACSLSETVGQHSVAYNSTVEAATDAVLVMNVLRARDRAPLHFTTIGALHGAFNLLRRRRHRTSASCADVVQPAVLGSTSPSFDVGPLDRQEFARGLLRPLDPGLFRLLSDRGLPDQLLLHLLVSRFDEGPGGRSIVNDPRNRHALDSAARAACAEAGRRRAAALRPVPGGGGPPHPSRSAAVQRLHAAGPARAASDRARRRRSRRCWKPSRESGHDAPPGRAGLAALPRRGPDRDLRSFAARRRRRATLRSRWTATRRRCPPCHRPATPAPPTRWRTRRFRPATPRPAACRGTCVPWTNCWPISAPCSAGRRRACPTASRSSSGRGPQRDAAPLPAVAGAPRPGRASRSSTAGARWWVAEHDPAEDLTLSVLALTTQLLNLQKSADEIPSSRTLRLVR